MSGHLEYLVDQIDGKVKTFEFVPNFNDKGKVESVGVSVYDGKLTEKDEIDKATVESFISLTAHDWATLLAHIQVTLSSKRSK